MTQYCYIEPVDEKKVHCPWLVFDLPTGVHAKIAPPVPMCIFKGSKALLRRCKAGQTIYIETENCPKLFGSGVNGG